MASSLRAFVERVITSGLLNPNLVELAERGATAAELDLAPTLPAELRDLLTWHNGLDLDVVRLHGVGPAGRKVEMAQVGGQGVAIAFASDPAGFVYLIGPSGSIVSLDHDGAKVETVAANVDDFLRGYVFGSRADRFGGDEWARDVAAAVRDG